MRPCGTAFSIAVRSFFRLSGRSLAARLVSTAIMPHPMSTPTAAGMIARFGGYHAADGRADSVMHIGHRRNPLVNERQMRGVHQLLSRGIFELDALHPRLDRRPGVRADQFVISVVLLFARCHRKHKTPPSKPMFTSVVKIGMFRLLLVLPLLALADDEAIRLNNLGALHLQRGGYMKAEEYFKASLHAFEATKPDSPEVATTMANLGETYRLTGRLRDSEVWYSRAIDVREQRLGPDHPLTANVLSAMACVRLDLGQPGEAERLMHRAISIRERAGVTNDSAFPRDAFEPRRSASRS